MGAVNKHGEALCCIDAALTQRMRVVLTDALSDEWWRRVLSVLADSLRVTG